ncbi:MAG: hypothetical protein ACUVV3_06350 [Dehalococcoidia bacterium]
MSALAQAIERKQWELTALYLLLGVSQAAAKLPPDAIHGLLAVLAAEGGDDLPSTRKGRPGRGQC